MRITHMFLSRSFFTDFMGMARKQPSALGFRTTEKSKIIRISYPDLLQVYNKSHSMERIGRIMAERQFLMELHLRTLLLNHNSKDLYDYLIREQPAVFQHFSLKDIASFMGIAPESLSRLRKGG
jgi:CRP-like cAMP-binding protein